MFTGLDFLIPLPALDAVPFELLLPLDFFLGQLRCGKLKLPDKAKVNFYLLHPVAVDALWGVDDDFLNKFVDHGRGQLGEIRVLPCQLQKLLHTGTVLCESGQPFFRFCDRGLQRFLLGFVIRQQTVKAFIGDASDSKGFIELFDDGVQLGNALFVLAQLSLGIFGRFRLPELGGGAHLFHKRCLIGNCEGADRADGVQNQGTQGLGRDIMAAAGGSSFLAGEGIGGTIVRKNVTINMTDSMESTPIAHLVQLANQFSSSIYFEMDTKKVNAKSIMGMMSLVLTAGDVVTIDAEGEDDAKAVDEIEKFLTK